MEIESTCVETGEKRSRDDFKDEESSEEDSSPYRKIIVSEEKNTRIIDSETLVFETNESLLAANKDIKRRIIVADPPWRYGGESLKLSGVAVKHYATMSLSDLKQLKVKEISAKNSILFMWTTGPQMKSSLELMEAWGFKYKTMFMVWVKTTNGEMKRNRLGFYTKQCAEFIIMGTRGQALRFKKTKEPGSEESQEAFANVFNADSKKHSEKPEYPREVIESVFHNVTKIELFARVGSNINWDCWGNEISEDINQTDELRQSIQKCREHQIELSELLDKTKAIGSWGGSSFHSDELSTLLGGNVTEDENDEDVEYDKYTVVKEHKDYFKTRNERSDKPVRYHLRRGTQTNHNSTINK